jgi:hypothetical protein
VLKKYKLQSFPMYFFIINVAQCIRNIIKVDFKILSILIHKRQDLCQSSGSRKDGIFVLLLSNKPGTVKGIAKIQLKLEAYVTTLLILSLLLANSIGMRR